MTNRQRDLCALTALLVLVLEAALQITGHSTGLAGILAPVAIISAAVVLGMWVYARRAWRCACGRPSDFKLRAEDGRTWHECRRCLEIHTYTRGSAL